MSDAKSPCVLFVYGSLLCGEPGFFRLRGARFLGCARTAPRFTLVDLGEYPAMLPGGTSAITGELYEVPAETLAELDEYEGHPSLYERAAIALESGQTAEAYLLREEQERGYQEISSGDWRATSGAEPRENRVYRLREAHNIRPIRKDR